MSESLEELEAKIAALERMIAEEPERLREEQERLKQIEKDKKATIPPSDEVILQRREFIHEAKMTYGEHSNARRGQAKDLMLLLLTLLAIAALGWWLFSLYKSA